MTMQLKSEIFVKKLLDKYFPRSYLESVPIFRPDKAILPYSMANEIDFILHSQEGNLHNILIIECKDCEISGKDKKPIEPSGEWNALYSDGPKEIKNQIRAQFISLVHNLDPLDERELIKRHGVVVSSSLPRDSKMADKEILGRPSYHLMGFDTFEAFLEKWHKKQNKPYLVNQSEILRRLRCSKAVYNLGHPETRNAISYSARCRRFIDSELFSHFRPRESHWAINGSAGMGKSVLLAYAMQVFITDMTIVDRRGDSTFRDLNSFEEKAKEIGLVPINERQVWLVAQSEKQRDSLIEMHKSFCAEYSKINEFTHFQRVSPQIKLWSEIDSLESCNVLLIDEAHDLSLGAQEKIREWHNAGKKRYLAVAIDRHQKLNLISPSATIIEGLDFSSHTVKLKRNYRNSFPVYVASFGILFRWFADKGKKVAPSIEDLKSGMGFKEAERTSTKSLKIATRNDSHPANIWHNLVSVLPSPKVAFSQLYEEGLSKKDVLWVRFSDEHEEFNYESLSVFTYFNLHSRDSSALIDKYIKGQEFPVVVIEGLPSAFSEHEGVSESEMWLSRRQVYMVSSRANVFLHFIESDSLAKESLKELRSISQSVSGFAEEESPSGRMWSLEVSFGEKFEEISMSKYLKLVEETEVFADETKFQEVEIKSKVVEEDEPEAQEAELEIKNVEEAKEGQVIPHVNREDEKLLKRADNENQLFDDNNEESENNDSKVYSSTEIYELLRVFGLKKARANNARQKKFASAIILNPNLAVDQKAGTFCVELSRALKNLQDLVVDITRNGGNISPGQLDALKLNKEIINTNVVLKTSNILKQYLLQNEEIKQTDLVKGLSANEDLDLTKHIHLSKAQIVTPISSSSLSKALSVSLDKLKNKINVMNIHNDNDIYSEDAKKIAREFGFDLKVIISPVNPTLSKIGLTADDVKRLTRN